MADDSNGRVDAATLQRLESDVTAFQRSLQLLREEQITQIGELTSLKASVQTGEAETSAAIKTINGKLGPNYTALALYAALVIAVVPVVWLIVTMYTGAAVDKASSDLTNKITPAISATQVNGEAIRRLSDAVSTLQQVSSGSTVADAASRGDRAQINDRLGKVESGLASEVAERREFAASVRVAEAEIETQFCNADAIRNLMHKMDATDISIVWRKVLPDSPMPTDNMYYPVLCHRGTNPTQASDAR
jgi:hypothetical protein